MIHAREDYQIIQAPSILIPHDEPVFLLRGQDIVAPAVVREWATRAELNGAKEDIVLSAGEQAIAMENWQARVTSKIPDLPRHDEQMSGVIGKSGRLCWQKIKPGIPMHQLSIRE